MPFGGVDVSLPEGDQSLVVPGPQLGLGFPALARRRQCQCRPPGRVGELTQTAVSFGSQERKRRPLLDVREGQTLQSGQYLVVPP